MITFLPFPEYSRSARLLDRARLGRQRVECMTIVDALNGYEPSWSLHPAVLMWEGYVPALLRYWRHIIEEWIARGYQDSVHVQLADREQRYGVVGDDPWWIGDPRLHRSHRSNLARKDPAFYGRYGWSDEGLAYWWPAPKEQINVQ